MRDVPWIVLVSVLRRIGFGHVVAPLADALGDVGIHVRMPPPTPVTRPSTQDADELERRRPELDFHEQMTDRPAGPLADERRDTTRVPADPYDRVDSMPSRPSTPPRSSER